MKVSMLQPLPVADERPHPPMEDDAWQESVVLAFQDVNQRIGGFLRIGHTPGKGIGNLAFGIVTPGNSYNRAKPRVAMRDGDRFENGFRIDDFLTATFEEKTNRWVAESEECSIDLEISNLHDQYDAWAMMGVGGDFQRNFAAGHTEVAGLARGSVRIGKESWTIDGYAFRDHSWGIRKLAEPSTRIGNFFWLIGSFGNDLIFAISDVILASGKRIRMGFVIKDGEIEYPEVIDASFEMELDGVCMRRASVKFRTPSFGEFDFDVDGFGNVLLELGHEYLESGMPALVRWGDRIGGAHVSSMFNARGGVGRPPVLLGTTGENGIYRPSGYAGARDD